VTLSYSLLQGFIVEISAVRLIAASQCCSL